MGEYGYQNNNGEVRFDGLVVYLTHWEPPRECCFVFSEELQGFGSLCENEQCSGVCQDLHCSGKIKTEITELVYGKAAVKTLKFSYNSGGKLWLWLGPAFKKRLSTDKKLFLEILPKENVEGYVVVLQLEISETREILAAYNITDLLKYRNQWNRVEIPLGAGGFNLSWHKLSKPGTLTLVLKVIPLEGKTAKGDLYLHKLAIR